MYAFEITIQRKIGEGWPVVVEQGASGGFLPVRTEGLFHLDLVELRSQTTPKDYGALLGQALFRDEVRDAFMRVRAESNELLRCLLCIEDPELKTLRWERLCAPWDGKWDFLALDQRVPFSLYLPSLTDRRFPPIGRHDLRVLVLVASPAGLEQYRLAAFDVQTTVASVRAALGDLPCTVLATAAGAVGLPTLDVLCERLTAEPYTLLHVVCHGQFQREAGETVLYLATANNQVDPVSGSRLLERLGRLRSARGLPHFAFLATCDSASAEAEAEGAFGGLAQRLVRELGMPAVVAMTEKVSVATAQALAAEFYRRLHEHGEVDCALVEASAGLAERYDVTVPALYSRLGGRPLFSDTLTRSLTPAEIIFGLDRLQELLAERAPMLQPAFATQAGRLRGTSGAEAVALSTAAREEHAHTLAEVNTLCGEVLDLSFNALALGQEPPAYDSRCPFRGLYPFQTADREFFFGREAIVEHLCQKLAEYPFLAVLGPSGSGKSSLVLAGLLPALQARAPELQMVYLTPGSDPPTQLETALSRVRDQPAMLIVDQFEELFTLCTDASTRQTFLDRLLPLTAQMRVVLTMRADFWGECAPYRPLKEVMQTHQELVAPMDAMELRRAMEMQAAKVGLRFEADLSNTILDDVRGEPGAMPLLQHALLELWQRRHGRWLWAAEYRALGGVQQAIARTAEAIYAQLSSPERERVRDIFVRLTRLDEEATQGEERRDTRRRVDAEELVPAGSSPAATRALVERLADVRLVVTSRNAATGQEEVEVAHEALIRYWPRLRGWLDEDRASLRLREGIREAVQEWQAGGKEEGLLVHRGSRLDDAAELAKNPRFALNAFEQAYVAACVALQKRGDRRRQLLTLAAGVVAVIFLGLALLAWRQQKNAEKQRDEAERQRQIAFARQLAAQAELIRNQPDAVERSVQLAAEATQRLFSIGIRSPEIDLTLRRGLALLPRYVDRFSLDVPARAFAFSANGQHLVAASTSLDARAWEIPGHREVVRMSGEGVRSGTVGYVVLSPDGTFLAASHCRDKGVIQVLQVDGGQEKATLPCEASIAAMALSPEGKYLAFHDKKNLQVWEVGRPREITRLTDDPFVDLSFSPNGRYLATAGASVRVWEIMRHEEVTRLEEVPNLERERVSFATFSADRAQQPRWQTNDAPPASFVTFFSAEGKYLATMRDDIIRVLDMANGQSIASVKYAGALFAVSPGGKYVAVARNDEATQVFEIANQQEIARIPYDVHRSDAQDFFTYRQAVFSPDEKLLAIENQNNDVEIWEITPRDNSILQINTKDMVIENIVFHAEKYLITLSGSTVHTWEIESNREATRWEQKLSPLATAFSADGRYLAVATDDGNTTVWEVSRRQKITHVPHGGGVQTMALSWDGRYLAMASDAGNVYVWELASASPRQVAHFTYQGDWQAMTIGRDGQSLAGVVMLEETNYFEGKELLAQVWKGGNKEAIKNFTLGKERDNITLCALSRDGRYLAMTSEEQVSIREMASGRTVTTLSYEGGAVCDFSANGQYLATAGTDGMVRVWEIPEGKEITRIEHVEMDAIAMSPEGKYLATIRRDDTLGSSTVRVWPLQQPELITETCTRLTRNLTEVEWQQYLGRETYRKTCPNRP